MQKNYFTANAPFHTILSWTGEMSPLGDREVDPG